ncbi:MAG TPA: undecaprenyl-diphosphate phosphatase [Steroidobacteraceae bacterium]
MPGVLQIFILAIVQGMCELLPVSSSAHVIMAEKLMGLDPTTPAMTFLLVMLHTGTMLAVIAYFWNSWRSRYFASTAAFWSFARTAVVATLCTGVIGLGLMRVIEHLLRRSSPGADVEQLFGNMTLIAVSLAAVGSMIILSGLRATMVGGRQVVTVADAVWIGLVQGLCLPFRGFSRSGATISTGLLRGVLQRPLEDFSFALAVILTPAVIAREGIRLFKACVILDSAGAPVGSIWPSLVGMILSFAAGWLALKWLSRWLERGRWQYFGFYCLVAGLAVFIAGQHYQ